MAVVYVQPLRLRLSVANFASTGLSYLHLLDHFWRKAIASKVVIFKRLLSGGRHVLLVPSFVESRFARLANRHYCNPAVRFYFCQGLICRDEIFTDIASFSGDA
jgi:hypothetical protein